VCGICGKLYFDHQRMVTEDEIVPLRDEMIHRGPDDKGIYLKGSVGLGHRRLSIIDIEGSKQPLANEEETVWIVFNGEIYNFQELRKDLVAKGHKFRTKGDTEVIVHLYEEYGEDCLEKLNGMFAFALWDERKEKLFLARDRLGVKPLYYWIGNDAFIFASEIKSILKDAHVDRKVNYLALGSYLSFRHVYGDQTLFNGINQLLPGHKLIVSGDGKLSFTKYWDLKIDHIQTWKASEAIERLSELLTSSVEMRMISDVPIGAFLSGGIDSSVIVALMSKLADKPVECFSVGFLPEDESELDHASSVAAFTNSHHHKFVVTDEDFFALMNKLIWHNDEPMTFPASIPLYILSRETKERATVVLSGEGADELFAGYAQNMKAYRIAQAKGLIPSKMINLFTEVSTPSRRFNNFIKRLAQTDRTNITTSFDLYPDVVKQDVCSLIPENGDDDFISRLVQESLSISDGFLSSLLYFQIKTYLCALLLKQDKMSMAASIETRVPYLDYRIAEFAFSLPDTLKIKGLDSKYILKKAAKKKIPDSIIKRKKAGFPVPIHEWFQKKDNPFIDILLSDETRRESFLNYGFIERALDGLKQKESNAPLKIWMLLNLELWRRIYFN